jgi:four helix bundle protein
VIRRSSLDKRGPDLASDRDARPHTVTYVWIGKFCATGCAHGMQESQMNSPIRSFRDLDAWDAAMTLAVECYQVSKRLPSEERFGLSAQIRRAAASVPSNIAEGHAAGSDGIFARHVRIALGSLAELSTQFELAVRVGLLTRHDVAGLLKQLVRTTQIVHGLARSIRARRLKKLSNVGAILMSALLLLI